MSLFVTGLEKLLVNDKSRASRQTNNYVTQALFQKLKASKWTLKTVRLTGLQKPQLKSVFQSSASLSICASFCICNVIYSVLSCFEQFFMFAMGALLVWCRARCSLGIGDERTLYYTKFSGLCSVAHDYFLLRQGVSFKYFPVTLLISPATRIL